MSGAHVAAPFVFPGSPDEAYALCAAITYWCANGADGAQCAAPLGMAIRACCSAHAMLLDQRVVGHLLFVRHTAARWVAAEFDAGG